MSASSLPKSVSLMNFSQAQITYFWCSQTMKRTGNGPANFVQMCDTLYLGFS